MSSRLTRRALFALPVALPVAAVAAKVGVLARVRSLWGGVLSPSAIRRVENLKPLPFTLEELWEPPGVKSPFRFVKTTSMPWRKDDAVDTMLDTLFRSSWGPAKFTDDELAATLGLDMKKSCGGVESRHAGSATRVSAAAPTETSGTVTRVQVKGEAGVAPGPQDTIAQPVVA